MSIRIKLLSHASFRIEVENKIVYIDLEKGSEISDKGDLILVTHSHFDHCDQSKIEDALKNDTLIIAPEDCLKNIKGNTKTLKEGEESIVGSFRIKAVNAYNFKRFRTPGNPYHPKGFGVGYLINIHDKIIYHAGDTDFIPEMKKLGPVDLALLPSGGTYTMDNAEAAEATLAIKPKIVIPMHRWDTDPEEFKSEVEKHSNTKVELLTKNQYIELL
jgi:L-ascorbate metabolism protein UlaG (beta-lactamase superfamily)